MTHVYAFIISCLQRLNLQKKNRITAIASFALPDCHIVSDKYMNDNLAKTKNQAIAPFALPEFSTLFDFANFEAYLLNVCTTCLLPPLLTLYVSVPMFQQVVGGREGSHLILENFRGHRGVE